MSAEAVGLVADRKSIPLEEVPCPCCSQGRGVEVGRGVDYEYFSCGNSFSFKRCSRCGAMYLSPRPMPSHFGIIYPHNYYSHVPEADSKSYSGFVQFLWDMIERRRITLFVNILGDSPKKILDVGCGHGRLLRLLRRFGSKSWRLAGVEFGVPDAQPGKSDSSFTIHKGFFETYDFQGDRFDLIVAQQVIEHAVDPVRMLKKMALLLGEGGTIVLDTPNTASLDCWLFQKSCWGGYHFPRHMCLFSSNSIAVLSKAAGLRVVETTYMLSPVFWVLSVRNLLLRLLGKNRLIDKIYYQNPFLLLFFSPFEVLLRVLRLPSSNMRVVLRKEA